MGAGEINNSYSYGSARSTVGGTATIGGFVGRHSGVILNSKSYVSVTTTAGSSAGGFAGRVMGGGVIEFSAAFGDVNNTSGDTGGFIGWTDNGTIRNSYSTGSLVGTVRVGGFIGREQGSSNVTIENCYGASPSITGTGHGFIGDESGTGTFSNNYWDETLISDADGTGYTGLTSSQMQNSANFTGWDFSNVWIEHSSKAPSLILESTFN